MTLPITLKRLILCAVLLAVTGAARGETHLTVTPRQTELRGKARGQNGFQLSLLGFDRDFDHAALTKEARGRRIFPAAPDKSLLLLKPTGQVAHGGGKRLELNEPAYEMLRHWIAGGAPLGS